MIQTLSCPYPISIAYLGKESSAGPLPAFFYFALSAEESLSLPPYNQPALLVADPRLRVFSFTLPGHEPPKDKFHAMHYWAEQLSTGHYLLEDFLTNASKTIEWLIANQWVDPHHIALGGLSRGGWVATHLAAKETKIRTLLGFAPLTSLHVLEEFRTMKSQPRIASRLERLDCFSLVENLTHLHHLRFYMGNRDMRVDTDTCYRFIRHLVEKAHEKKARHCHIELLLTPSIGQHGHGTSSPIFEEGSSWVKQLLLKP